MTKTTKVRRRSILQRCVGMALFTLIARVSDGLLLCGSTHMTSEVCVWEREREKERKRETEKEESEKEEREGR